MRLISLNWWEQIELLLPVALVGAELVGDQRNWSADASRGYQVTSHLVTSLFCPLMLFNLGSLCGV